jgi:hypothetical protein
LKFNNFQILQTGRIKKKTAPETRKIKNQTRKPDRKTKLIKAKQENGPIPNPIDRGVRCEVATDLIDIQ